MKFPKLAKMTEELWLLSINHHISSLSEVSCGMMNIILWIPEPRRMCTPFWIHSARILDGNSRAAKNLPQPSPRPCSCQSSLPSNQWRVICFPQEPDPEQNLIQFKVMFQKTMEKIKGRDSSDSISYLLSKTNLCLQGWAPRGSSLASLQFCWMLYSHHQVLHLLHLKTDHCRDSLRKKKIKNKNSRHVISKMFLFPKEFQDYNLQAVKAAWIVSGWA